MNIQGNTIFLPGGTSGIGLGLAQRFAAAGNTVIVGGRRRELLEQISRDTPGIEGVYIDTADADSIASVSAEVQRRWPSTNVLIAMAGIMRAENLTGADFLPTAEAIVTTNLLGPLRLIANFSEFLQAQDAATIVTVSSGLAFVPLVHTPTYNATKAAIHSFSEILRLQLADTSVQVIELVPPAVQTTLMPGQETSDYAMPLDDFLTEVMGIFRSQPEAKEILVENVLPLRTATATGTYDRMLGMLAASH
ncbi:SDR family oxidoreductase [Subtercola boreus]|uniref:Oxidoreductase n=1 Tax=Subtercola boreus TaxID=120213 RepID=A0A3E0W9N4_9MICO|nr:SDR family NAD(P)-dependent oxidoreductase [Subtercola boreus]RFA19265.1 oxidoreductase [Subtercola boreus]RFA19525.1 oxidoreductase [Subtercola boreus]RFA25891.1 oxidoreductase [Subtercola boreus]